MFKNVSIGQKILVRFGVILLIRHKWGHQLLQGRDEE